MYDVCCVIANFLEHSIIFGAKVQTPNNSTCRVGRALTVNLSFRVPTYLPTICWFATCGLSSVECTLKSHGRIFPILSKISRAVFAVPATAAQIESVWSTGGLTITSTRACLSSANVKYIMFCHENYTFCKSILSKKVAVGTASQDTDG